MILKLVPRGTGSAREAIAYLLQPENSKGELREEIRILRGNPDQVAEVADSLKFKHKYSSFVIRWAPGEVPSNQQIEEVLTEFERLAFPGLDPNRFAYTAVLHRERGEYHIHFVVARVDLPTGKSYNPFPPGWEKKWYWFRRHFEEKYGWVDPDTRPRALSHVLDPRSVPEQMKIRLTSHILQKVQDGSLKIENRDDLIRYLESQGFAVVRQWSRGIVVEHPKTGRLNLKGLLYSEDLNRDRVEWLLHRRTEPPKPDPQKAAEYRKKLDEVIKKVAQDNLKKYSKKEVDHEEETPEHQRDGSTIDRGLGPDNRNVENPEAGDRNPTQRPGNPGTLYASDPASISGEEFARLRKEAGREVFRLARRINPEPVLRHLDVKYRKEGEQYIIFAPWRDEGRPSVKFRFVSDDEVQGWFFKDFGDDRKRGDLIKFVAYAIAAQKGETEIKKVYKEALDAIEEALKQTPEVRLSLAKAVRAEKAESKSKNRVWLVMPIKDVNRLRVMDLWPPKDYQEEALYEAWLSNRGLTIQDLAEYQAWIIYVDQGPDRRAIPMLAWPNESRGWESLEINLKQGAEKRTWGPKDISFVDRQAEVTVVTESVLDGIAVIKALQAQGIEANILSLNGTGNTEKAIRFLQEKRPNDLIVFALDNDRAGRKALERMLEGLSDRRVVILKYEGKDPGEAWLSNREKAFHTKRETILKALSLLRGRSRQKPGYEDDEDPWAEHYPRPWK